MKENKFYFYKNMDTGFSKRSWKGIGALKTHLRMFGYTPRNWARRLQGDYSMACSFLASTHFYELDLETLETKIFTLSLNDKNQWVRHNEVTQIKGSL